MSTYKKTEVTNLITGEKVLFVNRVSLTENIVNHIIYQTKQTSNLLNEVVRNQVKEKYPIEERVSNITGKLFAYCEKFDLHAKYID